ncbi:MAG: hypothetical protein Unbinned306contig1002_8 [Prokaryotic dsDNA virus sp.]|nr:MAG: hypothetical protein Unbinned306contig1002_8 [Prokaryotic dsDNA virus sp.]|tara:strand:- start:24341 stop:24649 length:309 start_codon:yes stop_codon:yes gene_type:complete
MNNPFLNPDQIISGTESAYVFSEPLPVLNLYDRLKSNHKLTLNKSAERWTSASAIKSKLKNTNNYQDLSISDIKVLYSMIDVWISDDVSVDDLIYGNNLFEK